MWVLMLMLCGRYLSNQAFAEYLSRATSCYLDFTNTPDSVHASRVYMLPRSFPALRGRP